MIYGSYGDSDAEREDARLMEQPNPSPIEMMILQAMQRARDDERAACAKIADNHGTCANRKCGHGRCTVARIIAAKILARGARP